MTGLRYKALLLATAPMLAAGLAGSAHAAAFYLQEQSVRGAGRAFSGEGADTGAASLWWNPAAIGGMTGVDGALGLSAILPKAHVDDRGTLIVRPGQAPAPVGGDPYARNPINDGYLPSGAVSAAIGGTGFSVGLAVTSPFSFTTNYDANSWARYTADRTRLRTIDLQPTLAWGNGMISLGVGLNAEHADAILSNALPNLSGALPDGEQTLSGKGWDFGWSAGAQLHSGPLSVGLSYKSSVRHKLNGSITTTGLLGPLAAPPATINTATSASFRTPWQAIAGVRFRATDRLTLNAQAVRIGWKKFDAIRLGAPLNAAIPENYRNTWSFAGGVDYAVTPDWTLRAGVQHDQSPTHDGARDARVPDSDRWNYAVGTSYRVSKAFTIDAAASYIDFKDAPIDRVTAAYAGSAAQTPILVNGELHNAHALVLSLGGRFSF